MIKIAIFCVSYHSDKERDLYLASIERAAKTAGDKVSVDTFVTNNNDKDNPGYFGAVKRMMQKNHPVAYDYVIISNVDLTLEKDFFAKLVAYDCAEDTGWIAPQIWSRQENRDLNPKISDRYSHNKLWLLKMIHRLPFMHNIYTKTLYRRKRAQPLNRKFIYAGHGSFIILTKAFFLKNGIIDYPVFFSVRRSTWQNYAERPALKSYMSPDSRYTTTNISQQGKCPSVLIVDLITKQSVISSSGFTQR